jgi:hypothetical protein
VLHGRTGVGPRLARGSHKRNLVIRRAIPKRNLVIRRAIPHDNHTPALASVSRCQPPAPGEPRSSRRTLTSGLPSPDASAGARMPGAWTSSAAGVWRLELGDARLPAPKEEVPRVREMTPCARESHGYQDLARRCCFCRIARSGAISDHAPPGACSSSTGDRCRHLRVDSSLYATAALSGGSVVRCSLGYSIAGVELSTTNARRCLLGSELRCDEAGVQGERRRTRGAGRHPELLVACACL